MTSDIALFRMIRDRAPRIPDIMQTRYTDVISMLSMIRDGKMQLTASSQTIASGGDQEAWSSAQSGSVVFKRAEDYLCNNSADYLTR
jgi:phage gp36-like protein